MNKENLANRHPRKPGETRESPTLQFEKDQERFEREFQEVLRLLQAEAEIVKFLQQLQELKDQQDLLENTSSLSFLKHLERIVNEYASGISKIFHYATFVTSEDYDNEIVSDNGDDSEHECNDIDDTNNDDNKGRHKGSASGANFPMFSNLISSLLHELYRKDSDSLLDRLVHYLRDQVLQNPKSEFSHEQIQRKYQALVSRWSNRFVDTPILLVDNTKCATKGEKEHDMWDVVENISSWNGDENLLFNLFEEENVAQEVIQDNDDGKMPAKPLIEPATLVEKEPFVSNMNMTGRKINGDDPEHNSVLNRSSSLSMSQDSSLPFFQDSRKRRRISTPIVAVDFLLREGEEEHRLDLTNKRARTGTS